MKPQDVISYDNDVVPPFPNLTTQFPKFKFCKSVHHHTVQNISGVLTHIIRNSTTAVAALWFYRWSVVVAVLLVLVGPAGCYHEAPTVKPEAGTAVVELLMMGMWTPETC